MCGIQSIVLSRVMTLELQKIQGNAVVASKEVYSESEFGVRNCIGRGGIACRRFGAIGVVERQGLYRPENGLREKVKVAESAAIM